MSSQQMELVTLD